MEVADKPCSSACERNREPILAVLREQFADRRDVLEIGSGTGQHAAWFAQHLPHLTWHSSDIAAHLPGIRAWLADPPLSNAPPPFELDVAGAWPQRRYDAVFSSNTLHIMSWTEVQRLFARLHAALADDGVLAVYGPFNRHGRATCDSNAAFDASLRARAAHMGLRDVAAVDALASAIGLRLVAEVEMPANNLTRVWRRP
jgi:cyclopropane fatty-acyl-phospholipid synthase-like methyltransferase